MKARVTEPGPPTIANRRKVAETIIPHTADNVNTQPAHYSQGWRLIALHRATAGRARQPVWKLPDKYAGDDETVTRAAAYWASCPAPWEALESAVAAGHDVGLMPAASGLVVLDCDVKVRDAAGWVRVGDGDGSVLQLDTSAHHGIDDLVRVCRELGHDPRELATYTIRTKSAGLHLYYRASTRHQLRNSGHREGWLVDVVASEHSWVAAPPTPLYAVARDLPVAPIPDWLACWLADLRYHLPPLGGERRKRIEETMSARLTEAFQLRAAAGGDADRSVLAGYIELVLQLVAESNRWGGWNAAVYQAAHRLFDLAIDRDRATAAILKAAAPWDAAQERRATDTIQSAWQKNETVNRRTGR